MASRLSSTEHGCLPPVLNVDDSSSCEICEYGLVGVPSTMMIVWKCPHVLHTVRSCLAPFAVTLRALCSRLAKHIWQCPFQVPLISNPPMEIVFSLVCLLTRDIIS